MLMNFPKKTRSQEQILLAAVVVMYILQLVVTAPYLWAFVGVGVAYALISQFKLPKQQHRWVLIALGLLTIPLLISLWAEPSQAVLLSKVQTFMQNSFSTGNGTDGNYLDIVNMVINSVRAIYILFLVIAGWNAVTDFQQGQELSGFARNMLMSLLGVFVIDVMSGFIIP